MRIGELVELTDVSRSAIDNYYARQIISATVKRGRRQFPESTVKRVQIIQELTSLGFKLEEVKSLVEKVSVKDIDTRLEPLRDFRRWVISHHTDE